MCGRYAITLPPQAVRQFFQYVEQPNFPPRYNIAPTQPVPIVRAQLDGEGHLQRHFMLVRWGFLPGFVKDIKAFPLIINARSETVAQKPSFRNAVRRRRCLFIMDGYYEWQRGATDKSPRQPYLFRAADGGPLGVAGLWETLQTPEGAEIDTACLLTTSANGAVSAIHDRMPAILLPRDFDTWLTLDETVTARALNLLRPADDALLDILAISTAINKVTNDNAAVQAPC